MVRPMHIPICVRILFVSLAITWSVFYASKCYSIFGVYSKSKPLAWHIHQRWFNLLGCLSGWFSLWVMLPDAWPCLAAGECVPDVSVSKVVLSIVAFVGITGHLPYAVAGLLEAIKELALKLIPSLKG